jgi:hypothetical protein
MSSDDADQAKWRMDGERPEWDQEEADWLLDKYVIVGITYLKPNTENVESQIQYHGRITKIDRECGFEIRCEGTRKGEVRTLPPDLRAFQPARPGEYRLRSTGEVVKDPDALATWTINQPLKH